MFKGGEKMEVIGHDDEVEHLIPCSIEVQQTLLYDLRQSGPPQATRTMTFIKQFMPANAEMLVKLGLVTVG